MSTSSFPFAYQLGVSRHTHVVLVPYSDTDSYLRTRVHTVYRELTIPIGPLVGEWSGGVEPLCTRPARHFVFRGTSIVSTLEQTLLIRFGSELSNCSSVRSTTSSYILVAKISPDADCNIRYLVAIDNVGSVVKTLWFGIT